MFTAVTGAPITETGECSDCVTVSGVVVGTIVPTTLIPTNQTATGTGVNSRRAPLTSIPEATVMPRAPKAVPLAEPNPNDQEAFMITMLKSNPTKIGISPLPQQIQDWTIKLTIDGKPVETPIGVTGLWFPWPKKAQNFQMTGMSGCTGVFIVVCIVSCHHRCHD
jgi:hypothetical protein